MSIQKSESITFKGTDGVMVTIPGKLAIDLAAKRAEQVAALNSIIADHTGGSQVTMTEVDVSIFAELASELARAAGGIVVAISDAADSLKGGV